MPQRKVLTKEIEKRFEKYPLYSQDGKGGDAKVLLKLFNPYGAGTWIVLEAERQGDDWYCFGVVDYGYGGEYGYFTLNEILNWRHPRFTMLGVEREKHDSNGKRTLKQVMPKMFKDVA